MTLPTRTQLAGLLIVLAALVIVALARSCADASV